eukprot:scaffold52311_cov26-Tisochrysis_lutea.AAC.1
MPCEYHRNTRTCMLCALYGGCFGYDGWMLPLVNWKMPCVCMLCAVCALYDGWMLQLVNWKMPCMSYSVRARCSMCAYCTPLCMLSACGDLSVRGLYMCMLHNASIPNRQASSPNCVHCSLRMAKTHPSIFHANM